MPATTPRNTTPSEEWTMTMSRSATGIRLART